MCNLMCSWLEMLGESKAGAVAVKSKLCASHLLLSCGQQCAGFDPGRGESAFLSKRAHRQNGPTQAVKTFDKKKADAVFSDMLGGVCCLHAVVAWLNSTCCAASTT